jgi:hypothetical protein
MNCHPTYCGMVVELADDGWLPPAATGWRGRPPARPDGRGPVDRHAMFVLDGAGRVRWHQLAPDTMRIPVADAVAGLVLPVMAALSLYLAATGRSTLTPDWLSAWGRWATARAGSLAALLAGTPPLGQLLILAALAGAVALGFLALSARRGRF